MILDEYNTINQGLDHGDTNVAFVHIPKTGGTYLSMRILPFKYYNNVSISLKRGSSSLPFDVHMPSSKLEQIVDKTTPFFTIVRDAYDRTCSEYHFMKKMIDNSLNIFNDFFNINFDITNENKLKFAAKKVATMMGNSQYYDKTFNIYKYNMSVEDYLEWASENPTYPFYYDTKSISDFEIVGITEDLYSTIKLLKIIYNTNSGGGYYNKNTLKELGKPYETSYSRSLFKLKNAIEYDIYYEGKNKFNKLCLTYL